MALVLMNSASILLNSASANKEEQVIAQLCPARLPAVSSTTHKAFPVQENYLDIRN